MILQNVSLPPFGKGPETELGNRKERKSIVSIDSFQLRALHRGVYDQFSNSGPLKINHMISLRVDGFN